MLFMAFNYVSRTSLAMLSCIFGGRETTTGKASGVRGLSLQLKLLLLIILHYYIFNIFLRHALCICILPSMGNYTPSDPYNQHLDLQQVILSFSFH